MSIASLLLIINQSLELFEELESALEADRSRLNLMSYSGLRHDRADEIVSENMRPDFLAH